MAQALPHSVMYPPAGQQIAPYMSQYYQPSHSAPTAYTHFSPYPDRHKIERKRPKYTRSKTGCLTCRRKKVKCDETKPMCQRCHNSQLECTWPDIPPIKKKTPPRKKPSSVNQEASLDGASTHSSTTEVESVSLPSLISTAIQAPDTHSNPIPAMTTFPSPAIVGAESDPEPQRRHSEPYLQSSPGLPIIQGRNVSYPDITAGQFDQRQHPTSSAGGALGLTMHHINQPNANSISRSSTPNDYLLRPQPYAGSYSPAGNTSIYSGASNASVSSRPSTASSIAFSSSLSRRTSASSRPSTAGSIPSHHQQQQHHHQHQFAHRPASSGGSSVDSLLLGYAPPASFQLPGARGRDFDGAPNDPSVSSAKSHHAFASTSRPSTANSAASTSPFMPVRSMGHHPHLVEQAPVLDRWQQPNPSPFMRSSPLAHSLPHQAVDGYAFAASLHSTPQHSRPQSPWG